MDSKETEGVVHTEPAANPIETTNENGGQTEQGDKEENANIRESSVTSEASVASEKSTELKIQKTEPTETSQNVETKTHSKEDLDIDELSLMMKSTTAGSVCGKMKKEAKELKKQVRFVESLSSKVSSEESAMLASVTKKLQTLFDESSKKEEMINQTKKLYRNLNQEKKTLYAENQRLLMRLETVESVIRQQQVNYKQLKEESGLKIKREQERSKEVSLRLHDAMKKLDSVLTDSSLNSVRLQEENKDMGKTLSHLRDRIDQQNQETLAMEKQLDIQKKLFNMEVAKVKLQHEAELEMYKQKIEQLTLKMKEKEEENNAQKHEVSLLETKVDEYVKKYAEMAPFITQSTSLFETYKEKVSNMNRTLVDKEKEGLEWQKKYNEAMSIAYEFQNRLKNKDKEFQNMERKFERLQKLCRQLQADRSTFIKQIKSLGSEPGLIKDDSSPPSELPKEEPSINETEEVPQEPAAATKEPEGDADESPKEPAPTSEEPKEDATVSSDEAKAPAELFKKD